MLHRGTKQKKRIKVGKACTVYVCMCVCEKERESAREAFHWQLWLSEDLEWYQRALEM